MVGEPRRLWQATNPRWADLLMPRRTKDSTNLPAQRVFKDSLTAGRL
jgi:hypothetical protein